MIKKYSGLIIKLLFYGILFALIIFLPSVVWDGMINPTQTGKFIVFSYAIIFLSLLFGIKQLLFKDFIAIKINIIDILLAVLFLYITINRYFIQPIYGFSMNYMELIGLGVFYIILRSLKKEVYPYLLLAVVVSGIIQAVYGNLQLWGYFPSYHSGFKMTGSFFNPGPYAGFLAVVFPIALGMYLFRERVEELLPDSPFKVFNNLWLRKALFEYLPLIGIVTILLVLPASRSRAAILAVLISSIFLLSIRYGIWMRLKKIINTPSKKIGSAVVLVLIILGSLFSLYHYKKDSADGRLFIWKVSTNIIKDYPLFGVGYDRFKAHYMNYQADYFRNEMNDAEAYVADNVYYAFNEPLEMIVEVGIIGFIIVFFIIVILFKDSIKNDRSKITGIITAAILSSIVFSFFSYPGEILAIKLTIALALSIGSGHSKFSYRHHLFSFGRNTKIQLLKISVLTGVIVLCAITWYKTDDLKSGYSSWKMALTTYQYGDYEGCLRYYKEAYHHFNKEGDFLMNYGKALSMNDRPGEALKVLEEAHIYLRTTIIYVTMGDCYKALGKYSKAEEAYWQAWYMIPNRLYPKYLLAKVLIESGNINSARIIAYELLQMKIKISSVAVDEIKNEMGELIQSISSSNH